MPYGLNQRHCPNAHWHALSSPPPRPLTHRPRQLPIQRLPLRPVSGTQLLLAPPDRPRLIHPLPTHKKLRGQPLRRGRELSIKSITDGRLSLARGRRRLPAGGRAVASSRRRAMAMASLGAPVTARTRGPASRSRSRRGARQGPRAIAAPAPGRSCSYAGFVVWGLGSGV